MPTIKYLFSVLIFLMLLGCEAAGPETTTEPVSTAPTREFYQFKTYTFANDAQVQTTDAYLRDAFLPALKRMGIEPVGVFKPKPSETDTVRQTQVLIPFATMEQFVNYEAALLEDAAHMQAGAAYLEAPHDNPPYQRIESTLMQAFVDMPHMATPELSGPRSNRVYELRSYESATELDYRSKVDMFNAGGEVKLFDRLEFNAVFYAEVLSGSKMPNLMYMTTFEDRPTRDTLWKEFFASPEWTELKAMEKYKNNVSHADIFFLYPTEYSDY